MRSISEIKKAQIVNAKEISNKTKSDFKSHLYYLEKQYDLLSEIIANYYDYHKAGNLKHDNSNQFILCYSLLAEILRKQKIATKLILKGCYDEAAELIRHIMQSSATIMYLSKNEDSWVDWFDQQKYEEDKLINPTMIPYSLLSASLFEKMFVRFQTGLQRNKIKIKIDNNNWSDLMIPIVTYKNGESEVASTKNPRTVFSNFKSLLEKLNMEDYYKTFQKLCAWSHPSIESMRSNLQLTYGGNQLYHFASRYNDEKVEFLLNVLFGFVNVAIWEGFKDVFYVIETVPKSLQQYKRMQSKISKIFNRFYK